MEDFDRALRAGRVEEALRIATTRTEASREPDGAANSGLAEALILLARAYVRVNKLREAIVIAQEGLAVDAQLDGRCEAEFRIVIADAYERLDELERADEQCTLTTVYMRRIVPSTPIQPVVYANSMRHAMVAARVSERRGRLLGAARLLDSALRQTELASDPRFIRSAEIAEVHERLGREYVHLLHLHRGRIARKLGDPTTAENMIEVAIAGAEELDDTESLMHAYLERAQLAAAPAVACAHVLTALRLHEAQVGEIRQDELRVAVRLSREALFALGVDTAFFAGAIEIAWRLIEHARARVFRARMLPEAPDAIQDNAPMPPPTDVERLAEQYTQEPTDERRDELMNALWQREQLALPPSEADAVPDWVLPGEDAHWLPGPGTGVLEFFVAQEEVYGFLLHDSRAQHVYRLGVSASVLFRRVSRLRELIEDPDDDEAALSEQAQQLSQWLVGPHADGIMELDRLVIIPHGVLTYLPFSMLPLNERPLLEYVELSYAPSASILEVLLRRAVPPVRTATVFADPHPNDDLLGLPDARAEGQQIALLLSTDALVGARATKAAFRVAMSGVDVLHLACHANFDQHQPRQSALLLADPTDPRLPAYITVDELSDSCLDAQLVVLSGCQTGLADLAPGGELDGLVRAFLVAGARSIVASQWRVDDTSTADLMTTFYERLAAGTGAAEALRAAQLEISNSLEFSHPYYWSGFAQFGDWRLTARPS